MQPAPIPTPHIGHLTQDDYNHIYEPAGKSTACKLASLMGVDDRGLLHLARCLGVGARDTETTPANRMC